MNVIATFYDHVTDISAQENIPMEEALRIVRSLGIEKLEIADRLILGHEKELADRLGKAGFGISAVPVSTDFSGSQPDLRPVMESMRFLGADKILIIPGFFAENDGAGEKERRTACMVSGVNRLISLAAEYGISVVMEDFDNSRAPYASAEGVADFLERCPGLSCAFDTGNFRYSGQNLEDAYRLLRGKITHVHLKDRSLSPRHGEKPLTAADGTKLYPAPVGGGALGLSAAVNRLLADGYRGIFTLEEYGSACALEDMKLSASWAKQTICGASGLEEKNPLRRGS